MELAPRDGSICEAGKKANLVGKYHQASTVAYRHVADEIEFCLITTINKGRWGFPKGNIEDGESPADAALEEALEEAGLRGQITDPPLGEYEFRKLGKRRNVVVLLLHVDEVKKVWPEAGRRKRRWVAPDKARQLLHREQLERFIDLALDRIGHMKAVG